MQRTIIARIVWPADYQSPVLELDAERGRGGIAQLALGAVDGDEVAIGNVHVHTRGNCYRFASNSRHVRTPAPVLEDRAQDFTADSSPPSLITRQHTLGSTDDCNAESALDAGNGILASVDPQARLADPLELAD